MRKIIEDNFNNLLKVFSKSMNLIPEIEECARMLISAYQRGGTLYLFGNGGSAADAQHLAAEFLCRYKINRPPMRAIALTTDTSFITAFSNDFDYEHIFERQVEAFADRNDLFIGISTSGNSNNVLLGLNKAKEIGANTIGFLGGNGGKIKDIVDLPILVPSGDTPTIQALHISIGHIVCDIVEKYFYGNLH